MDEKNMYARDKQYHVSTVGDIVRITWEKSGSEILSECEITGIRVFPDNDMCLDDCMKIALKHGYDRKNDGTLVVIAETPLSGEVFRYGNHGDYWEAIGTVCGYA